MSEEAGEGVGLTQDFNVAVLSGLDHVFPEPVSLEDRDTEVRIDLTYDGSPTGGTGGGWRFLGEVDWRNSGELATGLTAGERIVEFRPVPGFTQPSNEAFSLTSDDETVVLERDYDSSGTVGAGSLVVSLSPDFAATNGRWRFVGDCLLYTSPSPRDRG